MNPHYWVAKTASKRRNTILRVAHYILLACGVLALVYAGYVITDARAYQAIEQSKFEKTTKSEARGPIADGGAIGEVEVPRLGLKVIFVQGDSQRILRRAVGHMSETAMPGEKGNVVLTAHRDSFFRPLRNIQSGDTIKIETLDEEFEYQVVSTEVVSPTDIRVLQPSSDNTLTLITCFPFYYVGPAPKRFIVHARQIGRLPEGSVATAAASRF